MKHMGQEKSGQWNKKILGLIYGKGGNGKWQQWRKKEYFM